MIRGALLSGAAYLTAAAPTVCPGGSLQNCIAACPTTPMSAFQNCITECSKDCTPPPTPVPTAPTPAPPPLLSRYAMFWITGAAHTTINSTTDYEIAYAQWQKNGMPGYLIAGPAYTVEDNLLAYAGHAGKMEETLGFPVWTEWNLGITPQIFMYDVPADIPGFIASAMSKAQQFSLAGFSIEYRPFGEPTGQAFTDFAGQFALSLRSKGMLLTIGGSGCPTYGEISCAGLAKTQVTANLDESGLGVTTVEQMQKIEARDKPSLGDKFWPAFSTAHDTSDEWSNVIQYLKSQDYVGFASFPPVPGGHGQQPQWYFDVINTYLAN